MSLTNLNSILHTETVAEEKNSSPDIDYYKIKKAHLIMKALNHDLRKKIIDIISEKKNNNSY